MFIKLEISQHIISLDTFNFISIALVAAIQLVNVSAYMIVCYNCLEVDEVKTVKKVPLASMRPEIRNEIGKTIRGHGRLKVKLAIR